MQDYEIERTAMRMIQEYGKRALPKAVDVAKYYLGESDNDNAKRWVNIGYAIKKMLQAEKVNSVLKVVEPDKQIEEA
jgi:hypothetical protein